MQFSDFLDQSGYTDFVESTPVPPHYVVFGYKQGICIYTGDSKHEAEQAGAGRGVPWGEVDRIRACRHSHRNLPWIQRGFRVARAEWVPSPTNRRRS